MRIDLSTLPRDNWGHFLRARDLKQILANLDEGVTGPVLEIGCGDGFLTTLLRERFDDVVPIDVSPRAKVSGLCIANAETLPFKDKQFGLVFSSNVLEHVEDLPKCLLDLKRVTRDDAVMIHTMPTAIWKILQMMLFPIQRVVGRLGRLQRTEHRGTNPQSAIPELHGGATTRTADDARARPLHRITRAVFPAPHGVASSHAKEFMSFRRKWWTNQFKLNGLHTYRTESLYLHSAYRMLPYKGMALREFLSRVGLTSVRAYWLSKITG